LTNPPEGLGSLTETFARNRETYLTGNYNETQLRREYVDKLLRLLGWDMDNSLGYAEAYKDVVHEDSLKIDGSTKAPDYSFRIGGTRKFFVETKRPSTRLKSSFSAPYQLKRYGWSAKLPLSILTNFDELAVYDCRAKPDKADGASKGRILYMTFTEYAERWDDLASVFSRDAILKGSFDKYAVATTGRRGTQEVDAAFLEEIETWRLELAQSIARSNPEPDQDKINFVVQQTIDRIIFLRICEDRGIEEYGTLKPLGEGGDVYARLQTLYLDADNRYNSGLFHFRREKGRNEAPDELSLATVISDKALRAIFRKLYYPESPYEFAVIPPDILGQVYERFLGRIIRLTPANRVKIEEKPDVKKAGGVYYTPTFVVDSIVRDSLQPLLENKSPQQVSKLRILDPACGSGSFLIAAYQYLMDWHLHWYVDNGLSKHSSGARPQIYQTGSASWRLTISERKRILLNSIFGVDIDPQAVEVTKLALLIKVLEGETKASVSNEVKLIHTRALPDLADNIKCGNSLVSSDARQVFKKLRMSSDLLQSLNAFDYSSQFTSVFASGGFDAVIGNPPWGSDIDKLLPYLHEKFPQSTQEHTDSFKSFTERGLALLKPSGILSFIIPSTLLRQGRLKDVRAMLLKCTIKKLVDLGEDVFRGVVAPSAIFVVQKKAAGRRHYVDVHQIRRLSNMQRAKYLATSMSGVQIAQAEFAQNPELEFMPSLSAMKVPCVQLGVFSGLELKDAGINYQRVGVGMRVKGNSDLAERLLYEGPKQNADDVMFWKGVDIDRYWIRPSTSSLVRPYYASFIKANEVVHLSPKIYQTVPKVLIRQTADRVVATIDTRGVWFGRSLIALLLEPSSPYDIHYFLGLLNSTYFEWLYDQIAAESGRVFAQVKLSKLRQLPLRVIDFGVSDDKAAHDHIVDLCRHLITESTQLRVASTPHQIELRRRAIEALQNRMNEAVFELYGVAADEIRAIEGSVSPNNSETGAELSAANAG
jgi:hypothetical protein